MKVIPLLEQDEERKFPRLAPTVDPLIALKTVRKALVAGHDKDDPDNRN